jgi:hypothetical protein
MSTSLPIPYVHTVRYFSKGIDNRGPFYRVEYLIDSYSDADTIINAMLGKRTLVGAPGGTISSVSPHQHPLSTNLFCVQAEAIEGLGGPATNSNGYPAYNGGALIRAEYRALMFDVVSTPANSFEQTGVEPILWATQELDFGAESYTIPNAKYTYQSGPLNGKPSDVPVKITIPLTTLVLTYERLPYLVMSAVRSLRRRVNTTAVLGAATGLVLFEGARTTRQWNTDGSIAQKTQLVFQERDAAYPWNSLPNRSDLVWYPVADGSSNKIYQTGDLTPLVQFF